MLASELEAKLKELREKHGDLEVYSSADGYAQESTIAEIEPVLFVDGPVIVVR
jgi:hypothetical protein